MRVPLRATPLREAVFAYLSANWRPIIYVLLTFLLMQKVLAAPGAIGFHHDWAFPSDSQQGKLYLEQFWHFWRQDDLGRNPVYPTDYTYRLAVGILSYLGISSATLGKALVLWCLVFAGIFMDRCLSQEGFSSFATFVGAIFYMLTPVMFNKLAAGHLYYTLAYALSPLCVALYLQAGRADASGYWQFIPVGILLGLAGIQIQFMPMLGLICVAAAMTAPPGQRRRMLIGLTVVTGVAALIHLPWLIPMLNVAAVAQAAAGAATFSWLQHNSNTWGEALRLVGYRVGGFQFSKQIAAGSIWHIVSYAIPVMGLSGGLLGRGKQLSRIGLLVAVVGVVAAVGAAWPMEPAMRWLFLHVPAVSMFREFYHLMFLAAFGYAILLSALVQAANVRFPDGRASVVIIMIVAVYATPFLNGGMNRVLQVVPRQPGAADLQAALSSDASDSRVLWTPLGQPMRPPGGASPGIDPEIKGSVKPALPQELIGGRGLPAENYALSQYAQLLSGDTRGLAHQLSLAGVKYIVDRPNPTTEFPGFTYMTRYPHLSAQWQPERIAATLSQIPELKQVGSFGDARLYQNQAWTPMLQVVSKPVLATGELADLGELGDLPVGRPRGTVMAAQSRGLAAAPIVITNDSWWDVARAYIKPEHVIEPGRSTTVENDAARGWVPAGVWWWYHRQLAGLAENGAFTQRPGAVHDFSVAGGSGRYAVLVKALHWPQGGNVQFAWGDKSFDLHTYSGTSGYRWSNLGEVDFSTASLRMTNQQGENVVAQMVLVPLVEWNVAQEMAQQQVRKEGAVLLRTGAGLPRAGGGPARVFVPEDGTYDVYARVEQPGPVDLTVTVGEQQVRTGATPFGVAWRKLGAVALRSGDTDLLLTSNEHNPNVSALALVTGGLSPLSDVPADVVKHSFDAYDVTLKRPAQGGEIVVLQQAFDTGWAVETGGQTLKPILVNGFANGFILPIGAVQLRVHYRPQTWYHAGMVIGWGAIAALVAIGAGVAARRQSGQAPAAIVNDSLVGDADIV